MGSRLGLFRVFWVMLLVFALNAFAETADSSKTVVVDSVEVEKVPAWKWPFIHIIQPGLNGLIYPIAKPIDYIFKNGVVEKSVELITFGERRNILIYPSFNFKPGSNTLLGVNYRHRGVLFDRDYLVLMGNYYANGDMYGVMRYSKQGLFGTPLFTGFRFDLDWDRDDSFGLPESKIRYTQPDSSYTISWRLGSPITASRNWNLEFSTALEHKNAALPDVKDSILISDVFPIEDRGIYQKHVQVPVALSLFYDNLDVPYAPSKGTRVGLTGTYNFVGKYKGIEYDSLGVLYEGDDPFLRDGGMNHDYVKTEFLFQHYFYFGKTENFILSVKEGRQSRKFYTDFSLEEAVRVWRPENVMNTLFERRVVAFQYRLVDLWEREKGGAPYNAFTTLNARTPLRGYADSWDTHHLMSFSWEYRWPVDRFVDGVLFDEYALVAPTIDDWSFDRFYNSWGLGIRVRQPNMYLFRLQFGFHGLHGVNLVMTIAPEFR